MPNKPSNTITWDAPEFIHYKKNPGWYLTLLIAGIILLGISVWQKDILMFITFAILIFATYIYSHQKPKKVRIELSGTGVKINNEGYPYNTLKSFWIIYEPPEVKTLTIETSQYINKELILQLHNADPNQIRAFLEKYLPENYEQEEAYADRLLRKLKF